MMDTPPESQSHAVEPVDAPEPAAPVKPRRKRKTKAEREAERAAQMAADAAKPIDPRLWLIVGAVLVFVGVFIYLDPVSVLEGGQSKDEGWIQLFLLLLVWALGKVPTAIIITLLGLFSLGWGVRGWLRERFGAAPE